MDGRRDRACERRFPDRMLVPVIALNLLIACSTLPPDSDHLRVERIEDAVLPMATAALAAGQFETARRLYTRLLDIDADSVDARMGLGDVALASQETAQAANWYLAAVAHADRADQRHAALLAHGRAALAAGDLAAARSSFARLTAPGENASRTNIAWGFNGIGIVSLLEGDPRAAVAAMEQAVLRIPNEPRFRANLERALDIVANYRPTEPPATIPGRGEEGEAIPLAPVASSNRAKGEDDRPRDQAGEGEPILPVPLAEAPPPVRDAQPVEPAAPDSPGPLAEPTLESFQEAVSDDVRPSQPSEPADDVAPAIPESRPDALPEAPPEADASDPEDATAPLDQPAATLSPAFAIRTAEGDYLQVGAYAVEAHARAMASRLRGMTDLPVRIQPGAADNDSLYRVQIGPLPPDGLPPGLAGALDVEVAESTLDAPNRFDGREPPRRVVENGLVYLEVGSYPDYDQAAAAAAEARQRTGHPTELSKLSMGGAQAVYRVRIGPIDR